MKKADMITTIQNKERKLWNDVEMYQQLMDDHHTKNIENLYKMARSHWAAVFGLMKDLGIEALH